jgi:type IX secretion system PorP/SprF family membrane protein
MKGIVIYLLAALPLFTLAQDMHFTQFNEHQSLVNPGLIGTAEDARATLGYKNQWRKASGAPYKSFGAAYEAKVLKGSWKKKKDHMPKNFREQDIGRLGAGLSVYRDKVGDGDMGQTQINLTTSAFVPITHWSFLSAGLQAGFAWRRMDQTSLVYPNQYLPGGYDGTMSSGETMLADRYRYFDLSTGVVWAYGYQEKGFSYTKSMKARFGVAAYHLTRPNLRVLGNASERLLMKIVVHGDVIMNIKKTNYAINPTFLVQFQGKQKEIQAGVMLKYYLVHNNARYTSFVRNTSVNAGISYRLKDAASIRLLYEMEEKYAFGLSYDINVSSLRKANHLRGGPELLIRYTPRSTVGERKTSADKP